MDKSAEDEAVRMLGEAARAGKHIEALPEESVPASPAEALAIQDRIVAASGRKVAGWKVATTPDGVPTYGVIFADDCYTSPAVISKDRYPLMGIEGEVAFRFTADLPIGPSLSDDEIKAVLEPFPAFEIVDSRFFNYAGTPSIVRLADRMSNGGMVLGKAEAIDADLSHLPVRLSATADVVVDQVGGHARVDPFLPALEFVRALHPRLAFAAGQFITAGTFTGLRFGNTGEVWELEFAGLGQVRLTII